MIDITTEQVFPLAELPDHAPRRRGRKMHKSTAFRWAARGSKGVRLETLRAPGGLMTSAEALARFFEALTRGNGQPAARSSAQRRRDHVKAERELKAMGI